LHHITSASGTCHKSKLKNKTEGGSLPKRNLDSNSKNTRACAFWTFFVFVHPATAVVRCSPSNGRQNRPAGQQQRRVHVIAASLIHITDSQRGRPLLCDVGSPPSCKCEVTPAPQSGRRAEWHGARVAKARREAACTAPGRAYPTFSEI
jgi:hypothetical protein